MNIRPDSGEVYLVLNSLPHARSAVVYLQLLANLVLASILGVTPPTGQDRTLGTGPNYGR